MMRNRFWERTRLVTNRKFSWLIMYGTRNFLELISRTSLVLENLTWPSFDDSIWKNLSFYQLHILFLWINCRKILILWKKLANIFCSQKFLIFFQISIFYKRKSWKFFRFYLIFNPLPVGYIKFICVKELFALKFWPDLKISELFVIFLIYFLIWLINSKMSFFCWKHTDFGWQMIFLERFFLIIFCSLEYETNNIRFFLLNDFYWIKLESSLLYIFLYYFENLSSILSWKFGFTLTKKRVLDCTVIRFCFNLLRINAS